jgi:hypothetical protein
MHELIWITRARSSSSLPATPRTIAIINERGKMCTSPIAAQTRSTSDRSRYRGRPELYQIRPRETAHSPSNPFVHELSARPAVFLCSCALCTVSANRSGFSYELGSPAEERRCGKRLIRQTTSPMTMPPARQR